MSETPLNREQIIEKFKKGSSANRRLIKLLLNIKKYDTFSTGDILVARFNPDGKFIYIDEELQIKQKYLVIHKEEPGIVFCQAINKSGKLSSKIIILAESNYNFELDPDLASALILDDSENYNAFSEIKDYRKKVDEVKKYNKKIALKWQTPEQLLALVQSFKVGQKIWISNLWQVDVDACEHTISEVNVSKVDYSKQTNYYSNVAVDEEWISSGFTINKPFLKVKNKNYSSPYIVSAWKFKQYNFFLEKPKTVSEVAS